MAKNGVTFTGLAQYVANNSVKTLLTLDSNGSLDRQDPITSNPDSVMPNVATAGSMMHALAAFGREFLSFFGEPLAMPYGLCRYTDGNFDASSPVTAPVAAPFGLTDSGSGNSTAGVHKVAYAYEYDTGTISAPSPLGTWTSAGGAQLNVGISNGGARVVAKWILVSPAGSTQLYRLPMFRIPDNLNTGFFNLSFSDALLTGQGIPWSAASQFLPPLGHLTPDGPGAPPSVSDTVTTFNLQGTGFPGVFTYSPVITSLTQNGFVVTVRTASTPPLNVGISQVGDVVQITGATNAAYNGTFTISAILGGVFGSSFFQYVHTVSGLTASSGGNAQFGIAAVELTAGSPYFAVGQSVLLASVTNTAYDGTWPIRFITNSTQIFIYMGATGLGLTSSGGGTLQIVGNIVAGPHQLSVLYETKFGYLTIPSPSITWTAAGGLAAFVNNIPTGPWYVTARRLILTASAGDNFFYLAGDTVTNTSFRIPDNTTTTAIINFDDITLQQGSTYDYLFSNFSTPEITGVDVYGTRLVTWGALNTIKGLNLGFDGGFNTSGNPNGWSQGPSFTGGGPEGFAPWAGEAWRITGDGATVKRGEIWNPSLPTLLALNTSYTIALRGIQLVAGGGAVAGNITMDLYSPSLNSIYGTFTLAVSSLAAVWKQFQGNLTNGMSTIPSDLVLRIYSNNTLDNGRVIGIDHIEIWPTNQQFEASVVRFSNPGDPETFDGTSGFIQITKDDGQKVMFCRQLRSFYYLFKERSMHVTIDDGVNPPSLWTTRNLDNSVGAGSPNAGDSTESFIIVASRAGQYMFSGGRPVKVSQEIQTSNSTTPGWESINWQYADTIHTIIDAQKKRVHNFIPIAPATVPANTFLLDYSEGMGEEDDPAGRKWGFDQWSQNIRASLKFEVPVVNAQQIYLAANKIYQHAGTDDDGTPIDSYYTIAYFKGGDMGQDLFIGLSLTLEGQGQSQVTMMGLDDVVSQLLNPINLQVAAGYQTELYCNLESERAHFKIECNALGTFFKFKGGSLFCIPNWATIRPSP